MKKTRRVSRDQWLWFGLLTLTFVIRVWDLDLKPVHFDEGINGFFVSEIWSHGSYRYNPTNFHGSFFFYLATLSEALFGFGVWSLRFVSAAASVATVALVYKFRALLGPYAIVTGLIFTISPAFGFYGRSGIHESLFVFFQVLLFFGIWRFWLKPSRWYWNLSLFGFLGCFFTKETWVLYAASAFFATVIGLIFCDKAILQQKRRQLMVFFQQHKPLLIQDTFVWLVIEVFIASEFFSHWPGVHYYLLAFVPWAKAGFTERQSQPWNYWFESAFFYEWTVILTALIGCGVLLKGSSFKTRHWLMLLGASLFTIYSVIPYKTPWCSISIFWPFAILMALLLRQINSTSIRRAILALLTLTLLHDFYQNIRLNFFDYAADGERYAYVHSTAEFDNWIEGLKRQARKDPAFLNAHILVLAQDPWPLPYLLSRFTNVHYFLNKDVSPHIIIADLTQVQKVQKAFPSYNPEPLNIFWGRQRAVVFRYPEAP